MMPGGHLVHSGVRRIEYLENPDHDGWEIDRENNCLTYSGTTCFSTEFGVIIIRERLENFLPLDRLRLTLLVDNNNAPPVQVGVNPIVNVNVPQEPLIPQNELHGPNVGQLTAAEIICIVQPILENDPVVASFLEIARWRIDLQSGQQMVAYYHN
ncbi:hypothetical protein TSUD_148350 [Trifolium subterraneum]|uniref:Uncharacterized protein n=1 Tax=Trifolium subterraneum TaxID=3900 RepID=A0A2Z6MBD2_TRISU|nr:hypothetical protein TSUD_148350 [Trifolium subterraneum]